jgi:hypothetical protein
MSDNRLPTEVELVYEVMPSQALHVAQHPGREPHPCSYFRKWGTYHSYDYTSEGPPPAPGIEHEIEYVGRAPLVPELLSGCRKCPIMAVGINPNLPGWWGARRGSLNPLFRDYKQYAHYFRYRSTAKLEVPPTLYEQYRVDEAGDPFGKRELVVPENGAMRRVIRARLQQQQMYTTYQALLEALATRMGWTDADLTVGEDLSYGNMVARPSAKWTTRPDEDDPNLPPMSVAERNGIVQECFRDRRFFPRQLFQSLPTVILVFSQNTANAFIGEFERGFDLGDPRPGEPVAELMTRRVRLKYGTLSDGTDLHARVIFSPHITGDPANFAAARDRVVNQLVEEATEGRIGYNQQTRHLHRPRGACVFCTMMEVGPCDYVQELVPLTFAGARLTADSPAAALQAEKAVQADLGTYALSTRPVEQVWASTDEIDPRPHL